MLAGRNVVVIADRDEVGRKHAREIAESLSDVAASVRVATTPAPHKDVSDLFAARGRLEPFSDGAEIARPLDDLPYLVAKLGIVTGGSPPHMIAGFGYSTKSLSAQDANRTTRAASPSSAGSVSGPVKESKK